MKAHIIILVIACSALSSSAQTPNSPQHALRKFVIEREIPNAGKLSPVELQGVATQSCSTMKKMNANVQWVQSYVTDNKVYCIYLAENEEALREHAKLAGFPAQKISEVKAVMDPTLARY
jgi:hypothetical protein